MKRTKQPPPGTPRKIRIPRWFGGLAHAIFQPLVLVVLPWLLSLAATRHGWAHGSPGTYNFIGLVAVAFGFAIIIWALVAHFTSAPEGWTLERTPHYPTPAYLITRGPYRYSRNPLYLADAIVWLGWAAFYGSLLLLGLFILGILLGSPVLRREERGLEARFGEAWRAYRQSTPRWFGRS
jgi:protein-S-isoprenylcysteine O-methyltransferase Ste14